MIKCQTKYCRNPSNITYLGKELCNTCWGKLCNDEMNKEIAANHVEYFADLEAEKIYGGR
jgi:hypothetical protein